MKDEVEKDIKDDVKYERFVAKLMQGIQESKRKISDLNYGIKNKIEGISGIKHQIDVSFIDKDFVLPTLVLIECKRFGGKPIDLEYVKVLQATREDIIRNKKISSIKSIIITTIGARKGAIKYSQFYGIEIKKLTHNEKRFTFQYENRISIGNIISMGKMSIGFDMQRIRKCENCHFSFGYFEVKEMICPNCSKLQEKIN